jgi:hypothetical protein
MYRTIEDFTDLRLAIIVVARYDTGGQKENCTRIVREEHFYGTYSVYNRSTTIHCHVAFSTSLLLSISRYDPYLADAAGWSLYVGVSLAP